MKTLSISLLAVALSILVAVEDGVAFPAVLPVRPVRVEAMRVSMACTYAIVVYTDRPASAPAILEKALDEVDRIDSLMSHYKKNSPLSMINREAQDREVPVESELFDFIDLCLEYSRVSDGAFDITVGRLMKAWGFFDGNPRVPTRDELLAALAATGYKNVILDKSRQTIRFARPGIELDLGGIAKGYAVDRVVKFLRTQGITSALVSAGGSTIFALGAPPDKRGWEVNVEGSRPITLRNRALSVSGVHPKSFESGGVRYGHIFDPRTGLPIAGIDRVVVLAGSGTDGDALDNLLFVLGPEASRTFLKRRPGVEAFFTSSSDRRPSKDPFEEK